MCNLYVYDVCDMLFSEDVKNFIFINMYVCMHECIYECICLHSVLYVNANFETYVLNMYICMCNMCV